MEAVQSFDPDRGFLKEILRILFFVFAVDLLPPDAVGVVRLIVHNKDVLLPADFPAQDAVDQGCVALHIADRLHPDLFSDCNALVIVTVP